MKELDSSMFFKMDERLDEILGGKGQKIKGESMPSLSGVLLDLVTKHKLFLRDSVTGLVKSSLVEGGELLNKDVAETMFKTMFSDRIRVRVGSEEDSRLKRLTNSELSILWENIFNFSTFNSRKEMYDNIPEWDGEARIPTFMKKYYNCDANPNFFLLFLTCVVGKIHSPEKNYTPFFFDFVSPSKGVGKTILSSLLVGEKNVFVSQYMPARREDLYAAIYTKNSIIVVDDECNWIASRKDSVGMSPDQFKAFTIATTDTFSRKYQHEETHVRSFVMVRTSNVVNTVFSPNERRQVIFKINLPERTCKVLDLPKTFFQQLLAEAKAYYEEHGIYKMTDEDWRDIDLQNLENINKETDEYQTVLKFLTQIYDDRTGTKQYQQDVLFAGENEVWVSWNGFNQWRKDNKESHIDSRRFWRQVKVIAAIENIIAYDELETHYNLKRTRINACRIKNKPENSESIEDFSDIGF